MNKITNPPPCNGKIITFYSFKGGVGRTMALANIALLAAMNGKRVLVMDWDLEAPGLAYYFRGMLNSAQTIALQNSPGILDMLLDWCSAVKAAETPAQIDALQHYFDEGIPFAACAHRLAEGQIADGLFPAGACLEIIGPGARNIGIQEARNYEESLAQFSWQEFFEQSAGGFALDKMRQWAKQNYDLVLIDSRTGLADVAGICTMQLPDIVALCFVMNQQNIDGIAQVAAAIHAKRKDEVIMRAVPMRMAQRDSADSSDAKARTASILRRVGGFSAESIQNDMQALAIPLVEHLPFYETLAPFVAIDPLFDSLTLSYLRLACKLYEPTLELTHFPQEIIVRIKRQLQPRIATNDYLAKLRDAEPDRACRELDELADGALATIASGGILEETYLTLLLKTTLEIIELSDDSEENFSIAEKLLEAFRTLAKREGKEWLNYFVITIENFLDYSYLFINEEHDELKLRLELDKFLQILDTAPFQELKNLQSIAYLGRDIELETDTLTHIFSRVDFIYKKITNNDHLLSEKSPPEILALSADLMLLKGIITKQMHEIDSQSKAQYFFKDGLRLLFNCKQSSEENELTRIRFQLHHEIAINAKSDIEAAENAIETLKWGKNFSRYYFIEMANLVLHIENNAQYANDFCHIFLNDAILRPRLIQYISSTTMITTLSLETLNKLIDAINLKGENNSNTIKLLYEFISEIFALLLRRKSSSWNDSSVQERLKAITYQLVQVIDETGIPATTIPHIMEMKSIIDTKQAPFANLLTGDE